MTAMVAGDGGGAPFYGPRNIVSMGPLTIDCASLAVIQNSRSQEIYQSFNFPSLQSFSQKSRTPTVAKEFQIGLCGVVEADLELFCNCWSAGFSGERLYPTGLASGQDMNGDALYRSTAAHLYSRMLYNGVLYDRAKTVLRPPARRPPK